MSLKLILNLGTVSGIFGRSHEELDILPPPPPFPDIGIEDKKLNEVVKERKRPVKENELLFWRHKGVDKRKGEERKLDLKRQKSIEKEEKRKEAIGKGKYEEYLIKKNQEREERDEERDKQKKIEAKNGGESKTQKLISSIEEDKIELPKPEQKKSFFGRLFGKRDEELERQLEELDEIKLETGGKLITKKLPELKIPEIKVKTPKPKKEKTEPIKDISEIKLPELELEDEVGHEDIKKAQEEIKKSIESIQGKKKVPVMGGLFKKKEKAEQSLGTPEVMPRTFEKIDYVQEIEERMHKARLLLMDFKFDDAKRNYMEIMRMYNSLDPKDRSKVYNDIRDLYYERKSAEKFASR